MLNFGKFSRKNCESLAKNDMTKIEIAELCKKVHRVDLGDSFQIHIQYLLILLSTCKIWVWYSRERALWSLPHPATAVSNAASPSKGTTWSAAPMIAPSAAFFAGSKSLESTCSRTGFWSRVRRHNGQCALLYAKISIFRSCSFNYTASWLSQQKRSPSGDCIVCIAISTG